MPEDSLHLDKVNDTLESLFRTDRYLDRTGICAEHILELANHLEEVGTRAVHLVDVTDTGNIVFVSLTPYSLRLGLDTTYGTESSDSTVEDTERTLYLYSEVNVSRGVNEVDFIFFRVIVPESGSCSRGNCNTALLLLLHPVHGGGTVMHLTDFVSKTGIEKNTLRRGSLTGIDVSHDTDVARIFKLFV